MLNKEETGGRGGVSVCVEYPPTPTSHHTAEEEYQDGNQGPVSIRGTRGGDLGGGEVVRFVN